MVLRAKPDKALNNINPYDGMKIAFMVGDLRLAAEETGVAGDVYILDASIVTPVHFAKFTPGMVRKFLFIVQVCLLINYKSNDCLNFLFHESLGSLSSEVERSPYC